ncbi:MAG TPA: hypothetical protein VEB19_08935 [Gemmatimonadaceae bacterium]|nr:hypothetical protein [Gemmatimonadaceae bacterium]
MRRTGSLKTALLCALVAVTPAAAQDSSATATIVIQASVSAREIRFSKQPTVRVHLVGGEVDSVRVIERRNLPDPVQPGVTYRDVYVAVEILGRLNAECLASQITRQAVTACRQAGDTPTRSP